MNPRDKARAEILSVPGWKPAQTPGRCGGCDKPFELYDPIAFDPYYSGWIGACCAEFAPPAGDAA